MSDVSSGDGRVGAGVSRRAFVGLAAAGLLESHAATAGGSSLSRLLKQYGRAHPTIVEADGTPVRYIDAAEFENWGRTVANTPAVTFVPRTKEGICQIVKAARESGRRVRAAGYRHSWPDVFSADGEFLISMLPPEQVDHLPDSEPPIDPSNELQGIKLVGTVREQGVTKALCRIGAATTDEQFRNWALNEGGGAWTVPLSVVMVEVTYGGTNAQICHGAGWRTRTLSDLVTEIEFVNARGRLQRVSDPALLKTAAGCFGLLGIVTSITLKLDPMTYATFQPVAPRLGLAIPPPPGMSVPSQVDMSGISPTDLKQARKKFVANCEDSYFAQWYWFPYQDKSWVNCWKNDGNRADAQPYPSDAQILEDRMAEYLIEIGQETEYRQLPAQVQAELFGTAAMEYLPTDVTVVTPLIEALHVPHGIQNFRVLDLEMAIPIPARADDPTKPDWTIVQRAWWDAIHAFYEHPKTPMRVALEMRVMGGSDITMAAQRGNKFGTCTIDVLTNLVTPDDDWRHFRQDVTNRWMSYTDAHGRLLNVRPTWPKQYQDLRFRGKDPLSYFRDVAYAKRIPEFAAGLTEVARRGGYPVKELRMFTNPWLEELFSSVFKPAKRRPKKAPPHGRAGHRNR